MKKVIILISFLIIKTITAQELSVQILQPPQYTFKLENIWNILITNNSNQVLQVYLRANANEERAGFIASFRTAIFNIGPGIKKISPSEIKPIKIEETNSKYRNVVEDQNTLPNGKYVICINVLEASTDILLSEGCSENIEVMHLTNMQLLLPVTESIVIDPLPVFTWLPPVPVPAEELVTYNLYITEILNRQTGYDAIQSNPLFYKHTGIYGTVYQYSLRALKFVQGKRYAWKVQALINNIFITESEVREFTYKYDDNNSKDSSLSITISDLRLMLYNKHLMHNSAASETVKNQKRKFFSYALNSTVEGFMSNRNAFDNEMPQRYINWTIYPTVKLYDVPFGLNIFLSTQNNDSSQNINSMSFSFDPNALRSVIEEESKEGAEKEIPWLVKFFSDFNAFDVGVTYPEYTPYSVSNVPITGVNIEYNPGLFYIAVSGYKNQKPIDNISFKRNLYSGRLGIGKKEKSHLIFTLMYAKDDENSIRVDSGNHSLTPMSNFVFGIDGNLSLFDNKFSINAEAVGSYLNRDLNSPDLESKSIPEWIKKIVHPKISGQIDYMFALNTTYNNDKLGSKLTAGVKMVGPGFISLGSVKTDKDDLSIEVTYDQKLLDDKIIFTTFYQHSHDNLIPIKLYRTTVNALMLSAGFYFNNIPFLNIMYFPYFQKNNAEDEFKTDNKMQIYTISSGYSFELFGLNNFTMYSFSLNQLKTFGGIGDSWSRTNMLSQSVTLKIPLTFAVSINLSQNKCSQDYNSNIWFDFNTGYIFKEKWYNTIGINAAVDKGKSKRLGFYFNSSLSLFSLATINLKIEKNIYKDFLNSGDNSDELNLISTLNINL